MGISAARRFSRCSNTETKEVDIVNNALGDHVHGQCMPVDAIRKTGAEAVLCKGMGLRAADLLREAGIMPYMVDAENGFPTPIKTV